MGEGKRDNLYSDMHAAMRGHGAGAGGGAGVRAIEEGARLVAAPPGAPARAPLGSGAWDGEGAPTVEREREEGEPAVGRGREEGESLVSGQDGAAVGGLDMQWDPADDVSPGGLAVVLQMPRGNLETVRPRALVLAAVATALDV